MDPPRRPRGNELSPAADRDFALGLRDALNTAVEFFLHPPPTILLRPMSF